LSIKNFVLHQAACKKFFSLIQVLLLPVMPFKLTMFAMIALMQTSQKAFY